MGEFQIQNYLKYPTISINNENFSFIQNDKDGKYILTGMFYNCSSLIFVSGINNWNSYIKYIKHIIDLTRFYSYGGNRRYHKYKWNNNNISDMNGIFYNCSSLKYIDLSDFVTEHVTNMDSMF